jgi:hypothetical protein
VNSIPAARKPSLRSASALRIVRPLRAAALLLLGGLAGCVTTLDDVEKYKPVAVQVIAPKPFCEVGETQTASCSDTTGRPGELQQTCVEEGFAWEPLTECSCVDGREILDTESQCPGIVERWLTCADGSLQEVSWVDPCAHHKQVCGPLFTDRSIDCGGCEGGQVCVPETFTCQTIGARDPVSGYIWAAAGSSTYNHAEAVQACEQLVVAQASDFRLPTISELRTLVGDCPDLKADGICRVSDACSATSCLVQADCTCLNNGSKADDGCYGGAIYDEMIENNPPFCDALWSATPASASDFWLISFDGVLNHREATLSVKALCIYAAM